MGVVVDVESPRVEMNPAPNVPETLLVPGEKAAVSAPSNSKRGKSSAPKPLPQK